MLGPQGPARAMLFDYSGKSHFLETQGIFIILEEEVWASLPAYPSAVIKGLPLGGPQRDQPGGSQSKLVNYRQWVGILSRIMNSSQKHPGQ